ncbi:E3 Ubiquitin-Protein Ligase Ubr4 [Manis pentadactyla]|nr:E3 Ubiquitin-Protein Ligase Ubr4 [Manis pentadactyla]
MEHIGRLCALGEEPGWCVGCQLLLSAGSSDFKWCPQKFWQSYDYTLPPLLQQQQKKPKKQTNKKLGEKIEFRTWIHEVGLG